MKGLLLLVLSSLLCWVSGEHLGPQGPGSPRQDFIPCPPPPTLPTPQDPSTPDPIGWVLCFQNQVSL